MGTQVAVTQKGIAGMILSDAGRARLQGLVPKGDTLERVASIAALEVRKNPALAECEPISILDSVGRIMGWGLEVGETAYLVPFGKKCQPMKGYQGLIQLMYDSGHVRGVEARVVYEGEHFVFAQGLEPKLEHQPSHSAKERGRIIGAYCIIRLPHHHTVFEFFPADAIDAIRQQHSKQWKSGPLPAWYALKTAVIHTAKLLPKNSKFRTIHDAVDEDTLPEVAEAEYELAEGVARAVESRQIASGQQVHRGAWAGYAGHEPPTARGPVDAEVLGDAYAEEEEQ